MIDIHNQDSVGRWVQGLIDDGKLHLFYVSSQWLKLRSDVLDKHKSECQRCKERGFYKRANTVHHVNYVRKHPRLALSKTYVFRGKEYKNLIPLCHNCHEEVHGYRQKEKKKPLTEERWE
ncbi:MAG TPA: HNH endonuclease [Desulfitobacterium dehalogenans]|uniref:Putative HNH nuclease YajD n=1 Tax=Desulfitobacterium dehalogenans TaxID=36854 RepID=A0A7C7DBC2_9FIRM|nr:HNH endonuclease [Desulfitobacterium dehalogenans]